MDPRSVKNKEPHEEIKWVVKGSAAAKRAVTMATCPCRLCALALNPPKTFAEYESLGLDKIAKESKSVYSADYSWSNYGSMRPDIIRTRAMKQQSDPRRERT